MLEIVVGSHNHATLKTTVYPGSVTGGFITPESDT